MPRIPRRQPRRRPKTRSHRLAAPVKSEAFDRCEPGLGAVVVDRDGENRGLYRPDRPAVHESSAQLGLRHPAWAPVPGLAFAETHQVVHPPGAKGRPQTVDINWALLVVEDMEYATVGDDVELPPQPVKVQHIPDLEHRADAPLLRLGPRALDGQLRHVHSHCLRTVARRQHHVLAGSAADVQHVSVELASIGQPHEVGLRPADVPGRRSLVDAVPGGVLSHGLRLAAKGLVPVDARTLQSAPIANARSEPRNVCGHWAPARAPLTTDCMTSRPIPSPGAAWCLDLSRPGIDIHPWAVRVLTSVDEEV